MFTTVKNNNSKSRASKGGASSALPGLRNSTTDTALAVVSPEAAVASKAIDVAAPAITFSLKLFVGCLALYLISNAYMKRFIKKEYRRDLAPANITDGEAEAKADAIYGAYGYTNDDFDAIANALTSPILNYNGYIKLYNAYGHRDDLDLEASFRDHFNDFEVAQLSSYLGGAFF